MAAVSPSNATKLSFFLPPGACRRTGPQSPASAPSLTRLYAEELWTSWDAFEPATLAFEEAQEIFKQNFTKDSKKRIRLDAIQTTKLQDVRDAVLAAKRVYDAKHRSSRIRNVVTEFSKRIQFYGNIMDVLAQHHPEYVALAWGSMKLVFSAILEHERLGSTLVNGLNDVADALPHVELASMLFPTRAMKQSIAILYAHILKFLIRALEWYEGSRISRAINSVLKPAALRYVDIINDIHRASQAVSNLAVSSSQVEQRDIHQKLSLVGETITSAQQESYTLQRVMQDEIRGLAALVSQMREIILFDQSINASARIEFRQGVSELQFSQALSRLSSSGTIDHKSGLQACLTLRDRRRYSPKSKCSPFWTAQELRTWDSSTQSSVITLLAPWSARLHIRDFTANIIEQLSEARVPVLWVLKHGNRTSSVIDILKSMSYQALCQDPTLRTDLPLSFRLRKYQNADSADDWTHVLGELIEHFKLIYVVINGDAIATDSIDSCRYYLQKVSRGLSSRGATTVLKTINASYMPKPPPNISQHNTVLRVRRVSELERERLPERPLESVSSSSGTSGK